MSQHSHKRFKLRLLLTNRCTAICDYCHNEEQDKRAERSHLTLATIRSILETLAAAGRRDPMRLSSGVVNRRCTPSEVAQLCRGYSDHLSMDSHLGHPKLLAAGWGVVRYTTKRMKLSLSVPMAFVTPWMGRWWGARNGLLIFLPLPLRMQLQLQLQRCEAELLVT